MTYTITENCIGCQRCLAKCPTGAVQTDGRSLWIEAERCNHCAGAAGVPQCWAVCPTNLGCVPGAPAQVLQTALGRSGDYWDAWFDTYSRITKRLRATQQSDYWRQWFDAYAQTLDDMQARRGGVGDLPLLP